MGGRNLALGVERSPARDDLALAFKGREEKREFASPSRPPPPSFSFSFGLFSDLP